jgi:IMP cyclohydrolase
MNSNNLKERAFANFAALRANSYPGRVIVLGVTADNTHLVQVYATMGRSPGSRNRVLETVDGGRTVRTATIDTSKEVDPLTIYTAMSEHEDRFVVTNGCQTDDIVEALRHDQSLAFGLRNRTYEPDSNSTSRISAVWHKRGVPIAHFGILRKSAFNQCCDRIFFEYGYVEKGFGLFVSTYEHNGEPLPSMMGDPRLMPMHYYTIDEVTAAYWDALDPDNRVSIVVKFIPCKGEASHIKIVNKYEKMPAAPVV